MIRDFYNPRWCAGAVLATLALGSALRADDPDVDTNPMNVPTVNHPLPLNALLGAVNGKPLFVEDVLRPIDADLRRIARVAQTSNDFTLQARDAIQKQIQQQIGDILTIKAATDSLNDEDQKRLEMFMNKTKNDILSKNGGSAALTDEYFRTRGSTFERELVDIRRQATVDLYLHRTLYPQVIVTRKMILDFYQSNIKKLFTEDSRIDLYTITIPFSKFFPKEVVGKDADGKNIEQPIANPTREQLATARNLTIEYAKTVIEEIKRSPAEKFPQIVEDNSVDAKRHSGGRWKDTHPGALVLKQVDDVAFSLPPHSIAPPLVINEDSSTDGAVMIIKVEEVVNGRVVPFAEAQQKIRSDISEKEYGKLKRDYYNKLYEKASIESAESMVDVATNVAVTRYYTR